MSFQCSCFKPDVQPICSCSICSFPAMKIMFIITEYTFSSLPLNLLDNFDEMMMEEGYLKEAEFLPL